MDNIYHYIAPLPSGVNEVVMPCYDGFTIYTADRLDPDARKRAYRHALMHIKRNDWENINVQEIEKRTHDEKI